MVNSPAFDLVRKYKQVEPHTEDFVMKKVRGQITQGDLLTCFERGISGEYGKFIQADPQTLIGWVNQFLRSKSSSKHYLESGLLSPQTSITDPSYPTTTDEWCKEANKCLTSFLNGVSESNFHPHVYDRMMLDGKLSINACLKYLGEGYDEPDVPAAKQKVLRDVFISYKSKGYSQVYFIK